MHRIVVPASAANVEITARRGGGKSPAKRVKKSESDIEEQPKKEEGQDDGDDTAKED